VTAKHTKTLELDPASLPEQRIGVEKGNSMDLLLAKVGDLCSFCSFHSSTFLSNRCYHPHFREEKTEVGE
jgi:hypothetical protein